MLDDGVVANGAQDVQALVGKKEERERDSVSDQEQRRQSPEAGGDGGSRKWEVPETRYRQDMYEQTEENRRSKNEKK